MKISKSSVITYDSMSLIVDGERFFPMMGEMHFSRYPNQYWEEELCKMKAGGIDIVSLYVIWIHHEEIKEEYDFTGDRDLRKFLETVKKCGLYCILRIGPWAHGEARNGGFPDWLLEDSRKEGYEVRCDDPKYLEHVRRFYSKTFEQAKGLFIKDDGPIIGIQIENEYGHCGGKNGEEGEQHMRTLKAMAQEIGFDTPIYTATGWGGAVTGGMIPVMGGYCEAPWDQRLTEIEPSGNYVFTKERNDHNIGSDHGLGAGITFDMDKFPFLTAELGGGLQVTKHRRPIASGTDTAAMTMVKLGSGANLLGYYMYHGGTNPKGKLTTLQETRATGYPNDLPAYSYDFNAPLREYGQMEDTYRQVRLIASFIHDFGSDLCDMPYTEQPGNPLKPTNFTDLRTSVRYRNEEVPTGYLFINNYQRRYKMEDHPGAELVAYDEKGKELTRFPKRDIKDGDFFFYPFNLKVSDTARLTIDATPVCILHNYDGEGHDGYIFYSDKEVKMADVTGDLNGNKIITITREEAISGTKTLIDGREYFIITDGNTVTDSDGSAVIYFDTRDNQKKVPTFRSFPEIGNTLNNFTLTKNAQCDGEFLESDSFAVYEGKELESKAKISFDRKDEENFALKVANIDKDSSEIFMEISYEGDTADLSMDGEIIADSFYTGQTWEVGLKRFIDKGDERLDTASFDMHIEPLYEDTKLYLQEYPEMDNGKALRLKELHLISQYRIKIY
ncbi:beta-galactosidase [Butyrivibrio proteoclasticus]|uniref:beta-galactosidase n=1 Tax=Butyrivibrio proteoclasticus TaxID=43305 RepID=UPI0005515343|nr:beta-galactosidase [Butyrivibrio proteoclasticus]